MAWDFFQDVPMHKNLLPFNKIRSGPSPLKIRSESSDTAEMIIYAGIGQDYWGDGSMISAKDVNDQLKALPKSVKNLNVRINSGGGDVFEGVTIYNRLKQFNGTVTVYVDGLAASIASIIALAGSKIIIGEGAMIMVHLPWTFAWGNRMELDNTVNRLLDVEEQLIGIYAKKTGMDRQEIKSMLEAETWIGADEAIEKGFADEKVDESMPIAASTMKSPWIKNAPANYNSMNKVVNSARTDLLKKISGTLARK